MDVIEITGEEYYNLICKLQNYQLIMFKILDTLASEQITARGSMYQKGRYDLARKIANQIEKEI